MSITIKFNPLEQYEIENLIINFLTLVENEENEIKELKNLINEVTKKLKVHIIVYEEIDNTQKRFLQEITSPEIIIHHIKRGQERQQKLMYLEALGKDKSIVIGNNNSDSLMLSKSYISIGVITKNGISSEALSSAKIICNNIINALELCLTPQKIVEVLRR